MILSNSVCLFDHNYDKITSVFICCLWLALAENVKFTEKLVMICIYKIWNAIALK